MGNQQSPTPNSNDETKKDEFDILTNNDIPLVVNLLQNIDKKSRNNEHLGKIVAIMIAIIVLMVLFVTVVSLLLKYF